MKRFKWPLQTLLDVTIQRELSLRGELLELSRKVFRLRHQILRRRAAHRTTLTALAREEFLRRIARQEVFFRCSDTDQKQLRQLDEQLSEREAQRSETMQRFLKTKASRETLERRRAEARELHMREQMRLEQKQLDEGAQIAFALNAIRSRLLEPELGA